MRRASARGPRKVAGVCEMGTTCIAQKRAPGKLYPRAAGQREPKGGPPRRAGAPAGADAFLGGSVCVPARAVRAGAGPLEHFAEENICKTDIFLRFRCLHFPAERDKRRKSVVFRLITARASAPADARALRNFIAKTR